MTAIKVEFDAPITCRENDDTESVEKDPSPMISETKMNQVMAAREKKMLNQIEKKMNSMGFLSTQGVTDLLDERNTVLSGAEQELLEDEPTQGVLREDTGLPSGVRAELSKLHKKLGKMQEDNNRLQQESVSERETMRLERRKHKTEGLLSTAGAVKPEQCFKIFNDLVKEDDELGDVVSVKTDHGDDIVPVADYIETFKEENPHLFSNAAKSGSGAGGGGSVTSKSKFSIESLRDPKQGGMSWEEYESNREAIISDLEKNKTRKQ